MIRRAAALAFVLLAVAPLARSAEEPPARQPSPDARGKVYSAKSADGLEYLYWVPPDFDKSKGADLLFIFHGSNLDRHWGFANHEPGKFRAHDIIVCPDGTTPNGEGGFNFRQADRDTNRVHALQLELRQIFKINATWLYGHSQGCFFAFLYAGQFQEDVDGVLGQAGGVWIGTQSSPKHRHQSIAIMHGTADPVVPFGNSVGALKHFNEQGYPAVHLRALPDWNHWPNADQAAQELAWCEGMAVKDPDLVAAALKELLAVKSGADPFARWSVGKRLAEMPFVTDAQKQLARTAVSRVEAQVDRHIAEITAGLGKNAGDKLDGKPWLGHLVRFRQDYAGIESADRFLKDWAKRIDDQRKRADEASKDYLAKMEKEPAKAFLSGIDIVARGFLVEGYANKELLDRLKQWKDDKSLKLPKTSLSYFDKAIPLYEDAMAKGAQEYTATESQ